MSFDGTFILAKHSYGMGELSAICCQKRKPFFNLLNKNFMTLIPCYIQSVLVGTQSKISADSDRDYPDKHFDMQRVVSEFSVIQFVKVDMRLFSDSPMLDIKILVSIIARNLQKLHLV